MTESATPTHEKIIAELLDWFEREGREWPWRATRDPWLILVSEVCLQQTQVSRAAPYINCILERFPEPGVLAVAPLGELLELWQGLGYPRRARNLWLAAQYIEEHGWPTPYALLPGVGPYTDAALRCFANEEAVVPPDINTRRVMSRLFPEGAPTANDFTVLATNAWAWGQAVMELGQRTCTARAHCDGCPVRTLCPSRDTEEVIASPRQKRYAGSMRQRRGDVMRKVTSQGFAGIEDDREAALSLVADGLLQLDPDESTVIAAGAHPQH